MKIQLKIPQLRKTFTSKFRGFLNTREAPRIRAVIHHARRSLHESTLDLASLVARSNQV